MLSVLSIGWRELDAKALERRLRAMAEKIERTPDAVSWNGEHASALWVYPRHENASMAGAKVQTGLERDEDGQDWFLGDRYPKDSPDYAIDVSQRSRQHVDAVARQAETNEQLAGILEGIKTDA